ncbi:hypothetical protein ABZW30_23410 [Kitasatospora sp. NPDC004669]|uniref:hypothetical protein n=1 Tax=Kitasatospora sp. NPDC004669 TaxID=3154555 RepID=UPI0033BB6262
MDQTSVLRYAFTQGLGKTIVTAPITVRDVPPTTSGQLPPGFSPDRTSPLPIGTTDLLERIPFWHGRISDLAAPDPSEALGRALATAFGFQRREPWNEYADHRGYASVRSKYPVHAFALRSDEAWFVDAHGHQLVGQDNGGDPSAEQEPFTGVALTGRYTHLPYYYELLRGSLVDLEIGINLRSLCIALEVFGIPSRVRMPGADAGQQLVQWGLRPDGEWSLPVTVDLGEAGPATADPGPAVPPTVPEVTGGLPDPWLRELVEVNRELATQPIPGQGETPGPLLVQPAVPVGAPGGAGMPSWAEVLYRRSAGRMPRRLPGVTGRPRRLAADAFDDALAWYRVPPPTSELQSVYGKLNCTVAVQNVDGYATGLYRVNPESTELLVEDPDILRKLEECYGTPLAPGNGNAVRHASFVWFFSARLPELLDTFGTGAWTAAQYCAGWAAHGTSLAAAAHGLYARPARAFDDVLTQPVLGTQPGETTLLSVICGTERYLEPALDLRQ